MPDDALLHGLSLVWSFPYFGSVDSTPQWINLLATYATRMGDAGISLESIVQHTPVVPPVPGATAEPQPKSPVSVIIITHETTEEAMRKALDAIERDGKVTERPQMIRIEEL